MGGERAIEDIVGEVQESETREVEDLRRNGAGDLVGGDGEVLQEAEVGHVGRQDA